MGNDEEQDLGASDETGRFRVARDLEARRDWARWWVLDSEAPVGEELVGVVAQDREWLGDTFGPTTYMAVHNPGGAPFGARWKAEGFATARAALEALARHLSGRTERGVADDDPPGSFAEPWA